MKINKCRNCFSKKIRNLFSLGKMSFTGKFSHLPNKIPKAYINLVICKKCKLVQLDRNFDAKYLYAKDYGYRTGINKTMKNHVKNTVNFLKKKIKLKKNDAVLDIASNDGTLLKYYGKKYITVGIDPINYKYKSSYKNINYRIPEFFNLKSIINIKLKKKFKIITALSVFYDLKRPNNFLKDVRKILDHNGIFLLEFQNLSLIIKNLMFDTICHEHLEYYSVNIINKMLIKNNLRILDHKYNNINGGSSTFLISHKKNFIKNTKKIKNIISKEREIGVESFSKYSDYYKKISEMKKKLNKLIHKIKMNGQTIHGYGASTKGNVLLQFCEINNKQIDFICDRNLQKENLYTPGTNIKIISEKHSRKLKPDYYLVLPWHFKDEILKREINIRKQGTKFIFPLPQLKIL